MTKDHPLYNAMLYVKNRTLNSIHDKFINKEKWNSQELFDSLCKEIRSNSNPLFNNATVTAFHLQIWIDESIKCYPHPRTCAESMIPNF